MHPAYSSQPQPMPVGPAGASANPYYSNYYTSSPGSPLANAPAQPSQLQQQNSIQSPQALHSQPTQSFQPQTQQPTTATAAAYPAAQAPVQQPSYGNQQYPGMNYYAQQQSSPQSQNSYGGGGGGGMNQQYNNQMNQLSQQMGSMVLNRGFQAAWQNEQVNLMQEKDIRLKSIQQKEYEEKQRLEQDPHYHSRDFSCDRSVMCCTLKKMPDSSSLLQRSRLPLGIILQPFKDDDQMPLMHDTPIVRCRACRAYINPYVKMIDRTKWQCNLCHRVNEGLL